MSNLVIDSKFSDGKWHYFEKLYTPDKNGKLRLREKRVDGNVVWKRRKKDARKSR